MKKAKIAMAFQDEEEPIRKMFPSFENLKMKIMEVKKDVLSESLRNLINDMEDILEAVDSDVSKINLKQVSISVQFNSEGGIAWIGSAKTGVTNSMTLTFNIRSKLKDQLQ